MCRVDTTVREYFADRSPLLVDQEFTRPATNEQNAHIEAYHSIVERAVCQRMYLENITHLKSIAAAFGISINLNDE